MMSRTRIVKGTYTKITWGDHNMYSKGSIITTAKSISEIGVEKGVSYGTPQSPPPTPTLAKCAIFFRPTKDWEGEFGFDWLRVGDSKLETDVPYHRIVGKYGNIYATKTGSVFTPETSEYTKILTEYDSFGVYSGKYYVPNMTLQSGETAILDAIVHIEEKADKLHYAYNTDLFEVVILKQFTVAKGINHDESALQIKCKKPFSSAETIRVIATKYGIMEKVGEIKLLPNSETAKIKVLFIPVNYSGMKGNIKSRQEIEYLRNVFKQSLVEVKIEKYRKKFIVGNWWDDLFFTTKNKKGEKVMDLSSFRSLHRHLDDHFMSENDNNKKYSDYYRVYCMPESLNLNGIAESIGGGDQTVIVFENRKNFTTIVHELLHSMGVYHTFDNDSQYTFQLYQTDNVMDYTHHEGRDRFTTNKFQWKILNKNII